MIRSIALRLSSCFVAIVVGSVCAAQPQPPGQNRDKANESFRRPVFLPPDRQTLRMLSTAKVLSEQGRYSQAVRLLQRIIDEKSSLGRNEDSFVSIDGRKRVEGDGAQSLKRAARRMLGSLPQAARDSYELQYGGQAEQMLEGAINQGDIESVAEVQRRYLHTRAGYRAMLLLAYDHLMQGNSHLAAICFKEVINAPATAEYEPELSLLYATALYRAGRREAAEEVLSALLVARKTVTWKLGDTVVTLPRDRQAWSDWLARWAANVLPPPLETDWVMFRGNATRTRSSSPSRPLMLRPLWQQRVAMDAQNEEMIASLATDYLEQALAAIPAMQPLAVGDLVLMRTPERVVAIDFESGKIVWQVETRATEVGFSGMEGRGRWVPGQGLGARIVPGRPSHSSPKAITNMLLKEQVWLDKTLGSMSSDGERLFLLEEFNFSDELRYVNQQGLKRILPGYRYNVLRARSIAAAEGKLLWSLGGPHDPDPEMQKAFFLGPPLPLDGKLYQIAELEDEVCLLVLDASTGEPIWRQQLAVLGQSSGFQRHRRIGGISPSYANGILVCPTGVGALVAVDLTSRNLRWGYAYSKSFAPKAARRNPVWDRQSRAASPGLDEVWADACAVIADEKVLITPTESDRLYCVSLQEGETLWERDRGKDLYLACVYEGKAILVGPETITALSMDSGEVIDRISIVNGMETDYPLLANGTIPSGRGYDAEGRYYLPVRFSDGGAVLTVNLDELKIEDVTGVGGEQIPGNLICHRDCVLSQNSDRLQCFYQHRSIEAQIAEALKENAADPEALLRQGEILFDRGDAVDAVQLFRRSTAAFSRQAEDFLSKGDTGRYGEALATSLYARGLLRDGLLVGLKDDFVAHADTIPEIESLIDSSSDRIEFLRVLAAGQEQANKWDLALDAYLNLVEIVRKNDPLVPLEMGWSARLSYLVRSKLDDLQQHLSVEGQEKWRAWIAGEALAHKALPVDSLEESAEGISFFFPDSPVAVRLKRKRISDFPAKSPSLWVMQELEKMRKGSNDDIARWAAAEEAYRYDQLGMHAEASVCCRELMDRWPNEICWNEKTSQEFIESLSVASRPTMAPDAWPAGKVFLKKGIQKQGIKSGYQPPLPVRFFPATASSSRNPQLWVAQRPQLRVYEVGANGRELWSVSLASSASAQRRSSPYYPSLSCARMQGHLLILAVGGEVFAIDTLRAQMPDAESPILWRYEVLPSDPGLRNQWSRAVRRARSKPRWVDGSPNQPQITSQLSRIGPITEGGVAFVRNRELVSVDLLTGKENWVHKGVEPLSEVFGNAEHIFVLPPESNVVEVYSPINGRLEGTRMVPPLKDRWTMTGAQMLCWRKAVAPANDQSAWELVLYDPWAEADLWVHPVSETAKASLVDQDAVAVFEKTSGSFMVLSRSSGEVLVRQMLKPDLGVRGIYVLSSDDSYFLITNRGAPYNKDRTQIKPMPQGIGNLFFTGQIIAINRETGKQQWSRPVNVEQWGLSLSQPKSLPLLILARRMTHRLPGKPQSSYVEMALIDKRNGCEIVPKLKLPSRNEYHYLVRGDKDKEVVSVVFKNPKSNFSIKFSEAPLESGASQEPAQLVHQEKSGIQSAAETVRGAIDKAMKLAADAAKQIQKEKAQRERQQAGQEKRQAVPLQDKKKDAPQR